MKKLVLTGAAGRLGSYLREPLSKLCAVLECTPGELLDYRYDEGDLTVVVEA